MAWILDWLPQILIGAMIVILIWGGFYGSDPKDDLNQGLLMRVHQGKQRRRIWAWLLALALLAASVGVYEKLIAPRYAQSITLTTCPAASFCVNFTR